MDWYDRQAVGFSDGIWPDTHDIEADEAIVASVVTFPNTRCAAILGDYSATTLENAYCVEVGNYIAFISGHASMVEAQVEADRLNHATKNDDGHTCGMAT